MLLPLILLRSILQVRKFCPFIEHQNVADTDIAMDPTTLVQGK